MRRNRLFVAGTAMLALGGVAHAVEPIGVTRAVGIAERVTGGRVIEVDLDVRNGNRLVYEIDAATGRSLQEIEIDAYSGAVLSRSKAHLETYWYRLSGKGALDAARRSKPLSQMLAALEKETDGQVMDVDFEYEDGQIRYEVEIATRAGIAGIYMDPETGKRLSFVIDD